MKFNKKLLVCLILILVICSCYATNESNYYRISLKITPSSLPVKTEPIIRVLILKTSKFVFSLLKDTGYQVMCDRKIDYYHTSTGWVEINNDKISVNQKTLTCQSAKVFPGEQNPIIIDTIPYYGHLNIVLKDGKLIVINEVNLEKYLLGVVIGEAKNDWPMETIKAFSIAARTYALYKLITNQRELWDVYATVQDQVYKMNLVGDAIFEKAISETRGLVLKYKDIIFPAYYHNTCGGETKPAFLVMGESDIHKIPPLRGNKCGYCQESPHYNWEYQVEREEVMKYLNFPSNVSCEKIVFNDSVEMGDKQILKLYVDCVSGNNIYRSSVDRRELRERIGYNKIKSIDFSVEVIGKKIIFKGHGWGHGVGLCQEGAKKMGKLGFNYIDILLHYYPESQISRIY